MPSNDYIEDQALLSACALGTDGAWNEFIDRFGRLIALTVNTACLRWDGHGREEKDLVSHVYQRLIENDYARLRSWRGESKFSTYLVQITKNTAIDYLRRKQSYFERNLMTPFDESNGPVDPPSAPAREAATEEDLDRLRVAIEALSPRQRLIMRLRMKGHSLREISDILNLPRGSVFGDNSRALEALRKALSEGCSSSSLGEEG